MEKASHHLPLVIMGSARKAGNTSRLVEQLFGKERVRVLNLADYKVYHYNYSDIYPPDDTFQELVQELLAHAVLVFGTPIYWYSMSGHMKVFFDRLTDLITTSKKQGRQLKGKKVFLIAVGADKVLPEGFQVPFRLTASYLDMDYVASLYCPLAALEASIPEEAKTFSKKVMSLAGEG
ncbi:flavodoxin family protein [Cesiribacter sp. SM1]|uniref:flavodoxin family protein n=1 Tax=Cesiribacter sp. SM1 TaxID=2861196 RepID=UPI001CD3DD60|nr:NAD(P)H-dependent oxidoreductase [Cesiribacter sp. SM1]